LKRTDSTPFYGFDAQFAAREIGAYRYGFNGKELDKPGMGGGQSTYDYGFRIYNPAIAKFLSVDPLTREYPWYTPYQFAGNMPIWKIDIDGLEEGPSKANSETNSGQYSIQAGDNYWKLENNLGLEHGSLKEWNPGIDPNKLKAGQTINVEPDLPVNEPFEVGTGFRAAFDYELKPKESNAAAGVIRGGSLLWDIGMSLWTTGTLTQTSTSTSTSTTTDYTEIKSQSKFYYATYTKWNLALNMVYVGRTSGYGSPEGVVKKRDYGHKDLDQQGFSKAQVSFSLPATKPGGYVTRLDDPSYWAVRGAEQLQIEHFRSLNVKVANKIEGISPNNMNRSNYINEAKKYLMNFMKF
jgi:RHS repeat-associated protein